MDTVIEPEPSGPAAPGPDTVLLYDNDCGFCRRSVRWLAEHHALRDIETLPWQTLPPHRLPVSPQRLAREIILLRAGEIHGGAAALATAVTSGTRLWRVVGGILRAPLVRGLAGYVYRKVAANRHRMPGGTAACALPVRPAASTEPGL